LNGFEEGLTSAQKDNQVVVCLLACLLASMNDVMVIWGTAKQAKPFANVMRHSFV